MAIRGVVDKRRQDRLTAHLVTAGCVFAANFLLLIVADLAREETAAYVGAILIILCVGTLVSGFAINIIDRYFTKPRPIHCLYCRMVLPLHSDWRCGCCNAKNSGSPLDDCQKCGSHSCAVTCPNPHCQQAVLLRAPLNSTPPAMFLKDDQDIDLHTEQLELHRRQQEIIEKDRQLAEAEAELLHVQRKAALARQALAKAQETPEQTYEREVLGLLQSEGKRRQVMKKLRDDIEQDADPEEQAWKRGVLDRIERESLEL